MAKQGLAKIGETPFYTEYTDFLGTGVILRTMKARIGAGRTTCVAPATGTYAAMQAHTTLLGVAGARWQVTDVGVGGSEWKSDGTTWRPVGTVVVTGAPTFTAPNGSLAIRTDGTTAGTNLYVRVNGAWVASAT